MEIFKHTPNWASVERRLRMNNMKSSEDASQVLPLNSDKFFYKEEKKNRATEDALCSICKKAQHLPSVCPEKQTAPAGKPETSGIYIPSFQFTPTTVRLTNVPTDIPKDQVREHIRERMLTNNVQYDILSLLTDKQYREEFKGIVYIELPTAEIAERCLALFDGMKMGVQIISAVTVESRRDRS
ncbi:uncharacterized protein NEMAJ01_0120 [Nematocida major]|uniref:uncharacterized protein n=1 Tax=Nematocida major TaxID=1912982 RepID=UPI002008AF82|nr:uncharacterized protein NEMAJ01_0120 [Nematocida major]KAH9385224.1 hypothetical protein NEMAJ01_0120 [Nematocida major]